MTRISLQGSCGWDSENSGQCIYCRLRFDGLLKFYCQTSLLGFYQLCKYTSPIFTTWQRGCPAAPRPHSFLAVGMLASCQPQAFAFLWIPLTSVTPRILLQTSNGDFLALVTRIFRDRLFAPSTWQSIEI